jgi:uncharacterized membrane protein
MARLTDKEMEAEIGVMLRAGVTLSAAVVLLGGILYLSRATQLPDYQHFQSTADPLHSLLGILRGVLRLDAASVIEFGILLLIATPIVRVVLCVVGFARQRSLLYTGVSALVLLILLYSVAQGGW